LFVLGTTPVPLLSLPAPRRFVLSLYRKRDVLAAEVAMRMRALTGTQQAEARRIVGAVAGASAIDGRTGGGHAPRDAILVAHRNVSCLLT